VPPKKKRLDPEEQAQVVADARHALEARDKGYRGQALALFPHVCGRCSREFSGKTLRELTVHHRDGNHMNNPPDGSNWELLCLYCHDDEHGGYTSKAGYSLDSNTEPSLDFRPFEGLGDLLKPKDGEADPGKT